ncbi:fimbrial protein [Serratia fonticola]|uniref:fimbrial protein n=1 Tax=Serratia fonticola TaxID=47917 RepID=UPI000E0EF12B|nr:fimbrial protein [Serratia fonticola]RDL14117.1 minor fimbrial subunit [Serratia fonticola]
MKSAFKNFALAMLVIISGMTIVHAAPVNINITGLVVASACTVNNNLSNLNVNLGAAIPASTLTTGASSTPTPFSLALTSCPVGTNSVKVTFTGTPDTATGGTRFKNTGTATNVSVELSQQGTGTILSNNSALTQSVLADRTVTYMLSARANATGQATPGTISAVVVADFTYN